MRRLVLWGLILIAIAGVAAGLYWFRHQTTGAGDTEILRTDRVTQGDLEIAVSTSGQIAAKAKLSVVVTTGGTVEQIWVAVNDEVRAGQRLATMDTTNLERALRQVEIALEQAELALATAVDPVEPEELRVAQAALTNATQALEVARLGRETARVDADAMIVQAQRQREQAHIRYREANDGSEKERTGKALQEAETEEHIARLNATLTQEQAQAQWQVAYNAYVQAQTNLSALREAGDDITIRQQELRVEQAQLQVQRAQRAVDEAVITAPQSGVIAEVRLLEGANYRAGETAFVIIDVSDFFVEVKIDEIDIGALSIGQDAELSLDAYPGVPLPCAVHSIAPAATNVGGLITYDVRLRVKETSGLRILEGMTGTARIVTAVVEDTLLVPSWAVRVDQETAETYCYRVVDGVAERTAIELGRRDEINSEVLSGLSTGDEVALVTTQRSLLDIVSEAGPPGGGLR